MMVLHGPDQALLEDIVRDRFVADPTAQERSKRRLMLNEPFHDGVAFRLAVHRLSPLAAHSPPSLLTS
jgi:hypothetical protein